MNKFPQISIQGAPYERGHEYGSKCAKLIAKRVEILRSLIDSEDYFGLSWEKAVRKAEECQKHVERYDARMIEEMEGISEGANTTFDVILFLNSVYEFFSLKVDGVWSGCTTIAALPECTEERTTLIGQNDDWSELFQQTHILLRIKQKEGPDIFQFTEAGTIGGNGINSAGIGLCANSLLSSGWSMEGIPHLFIKRGILSSSNFVDAIKAVTAVPRCSSHNYLVTHVDGECVDIEATPKTADFIFPSTGFLTHTNHFTANNPKVTDNKVLKSPDTLIRKHRADKILSSEVGSLSIESFKRVFTDHFSKPHSVCRHPDEKLPSLRQMQTNASMIIDLTNVRMMISHGPPCINQYQEVSIWN